MYIDMPFKDIGIEMIINLYVIYVNKMHKLLLHIMYAAVLSLSYKILID